APHKAGPCTPGAGAATPSRHSPRARPSPARSPDHHPPPVRPATSRQRTTAAACPETAPRTQKASARTRTTRDRAPCHDTHPNVRPKRENRPHRNVKTSRVRSSRLGMAWGNGALVEGCPQVKRAVTTLSGGYRSGSAGGLRLLAAVCLDDFEGEV